MVLPTVAPVGNARSVSIAGLSALLPESLSRKFFLLPPQFGDYAAQDNVELLHAQHDGAIDVSRADEVFT